MMNRTEVLKLLVGHRTNEIVVTIMMAIREWNVVSNRPELDFGLFGAMGQAPSVGLGLAMARPDRKVWVLNGDGSQLMSMGTVATIVATGVKNLVVFVFENGIYETTGGQPIPGAERVDYAGAARALGMVNSYSFDEVDVLRAELPGILAAEGPAFINLKTVTGDRVPHYSSGMMEQSRKLERALAAGA